MQQERKSLVTELLKSIDQQNQSLTQNQSLHEFQWFEFDNKIRLLVHQLLEPHLQQFVDQRCDYQRQKIQKKISLTIKVDKYIQNYEEFKQLYFQNGKGTPIIQQLRQQILELQQNFDHLQQTAQFTINENNRKLDSIQFLKDQQYHQLKMIENNQQLQNEQLDKYRQQNQEFKTILMDVLDQNKIDLQNQILIINEKLQNFNLNIDKHHLIQQDLKTKIDNNYDILSTYQDKIINSINISQSNLQKLQLLEKKFPKLDELLAYDRKVSNELMLMNNRLKYFENYIEKYFPLYLQGVMSDTLHNCLTEESKYKLAKYEEDKFTELHKIIVNDDGNPNLDKKINDYTAFIERQLKKNMSFLRDYQNTNNNNNFLQLSNLAEMELSSKISQKLTTPQSDDSSERVGLKNQEFKVDRQEIEYFLQNKFNEFKQNIEKIIEQTQEQVEKLDLSFNLLHQKMISQFEFIKQQNSDSTQQITQQINELIEQYNNIPILTKELYEIQSQQQSTIQKLLQSQILLIQKNQEEIQFNGQVVTQEQCQQLLNQMVVQLGYENESNIFHSPIKKQKPQLNLDERRSIRIKTASQSGMRKSIQSTSQTKSASEKRKLYLLGSKIQQELCQSLNDSVLNPRKTNAKLLFYSKANQHD